MSHTARTDAAPRAARSFTRFVRTSIKPVIFKLTRKLSVTYWPARLRTISATLAALLVQFVPGFAFAAPTGAQVVAGSASVTRPSATSTQVTQATQNAIINWQSFSIGAKESVNFVQPNASSVALNRVIGSDPSAIFGALSANGQVFLVNNAGVYFAPGASVNVGGLVASSLNITDANFLAGKYQFDAGLGAGAVSNDGRLRGAYVVLSAPQVANAGSIEAGGVALAAGGRVNLDLAGDKLVSLSVDAAIANAALTHSGSISADGGKVFMTARSANAVLDTVINTRGIVRANSIVSRNGQIVIDGGERGVVAIEGTLSAAGFDAGTVGGTVKVLGDKVGLFAGANVNVSGVAGGGTALIGGNFHGAGLEHNASATFVDKSAIINADAVNSGKGGNVAVWADGHTSFAGSISARGGAQGGDGGSVETSGKATLAFGGFVDTSAAKGKAGTLLLDPTDITISSAASSATMNPTTPFTDVTTATGTSVLNNHDLEIALGSNNVTVNTLSPQIAPNGGSIRVDAPISWSSGNALTLKANNAISINNQIINSGTGALHLQANGAIDIAAPRFISLSGGAFSVAGYAGGASKAGSFNNGGYIDSGSGAVAIQSAGSVTLAGIDSGGGTLSISSDAGVIINGALSSSNQTSDAIRIIAGANAAAGTAAGGDIKFFPDGRINVNGAGRATLLTGSLSGSSNVAARVGSGSAHFRYNSDESAANYSAPLSSGLYAVYREQPILTITADSTAMTYGAAVPAFTSSASGRVNGDTLSQILSSNGTVTAAGAMSGSGHLVAGGHALNVAGAMDSLGYAISYVAGNLAVAKANLALAGTRTYDGSRIVDGSVLSATGVAGESFAVSGAGDASNLASKNVGTGALSSLTGLSLGAGSGGADIANYNVLGIVGSSIAITAKALTIAAAGTNKVYDGFSSAAVTLSDDRVAGDALTTTYVASYGDKNVGNAKTIGVSGLNLGGTDAGNYTFNTAAATSANITAKALTIAAAGINKVYDGASSATVTLSDDRIAGDALTTTYVASYSDKNVGNAKTIGVSGLNLGGTDAGNYTFNTAAATSANITAKALTIAAAGINKVYDGTSSATVTLSDDRIAGDALTTTYVASYGDKNVGNAKVVGVTGLNLGGTDAGNYTFNSAAATTANITRLASVSWIGGPSGDWSLASNWAGGAIPDFANVARVIIPSGSTVNFDFSIGMLNGAVQLDSISSAGGLNVNSGSLAVSGMLATGSYAQSGGLVSAANLVAANNFKQTGGSLNVTGLVDIAQAVGVAELGNIHAHDLTVTSAGGVTQATGTALATAGTTTLDTGSGDVALGNAGNDFGTVVIGNANNVTLLDVNELILGSSAISGKLNIDSGALTQSAGSTLAVAGIAILNAHGANVTLGNAGNDFATVAVTSANDVILRDANALNLGSSVISGNLTIASGALTQLAGSALAVAETTTLNANGANVALGNAGNDFGTVALNNVNSATLQDVNALNLGSSVVHGNLTIDSGALTQSAGSALTMAGTTTLNANGANVTLGNAGNDFAWVAISSANNVTLLDVNALKLGGSTINGSLTIDSGALTQLAGSVLAVAGTTTLNANGANVTLDNSGNDFGSVAISSANNVTLFDVNALNLGGSVINGNLIIDSGALNQLSGATLAVAGTTTLNANGANVNLGNAGNDFATVAVSNANNVTLQDANALILGGSTINGNLNIASSALTQSAGATLTVAGTTTLNANGANVTLANAGNDFGTVALNHVAEVTLRDANALNLGGSVINGNLNIDSGTLSQAAGATLAVAGTTTLNANGANVTFANAGNNFGTVSLNNVNNTTLADVNALVIGGSVIGGNLTIDSGALTQSAGSTLIVAGVTALNANGANVTLANAGNDFGTVAINKANDVALQDANALNLGRSVINGNLNIDSGALTQAAGATLTVAGETSLNTNGANVTLANAGNDFATIAVNNAVDVTLTDKNALNLASSSIGGNLNILAGGISQSAASTLTVAGSSTLNAGAGDVVLNNAGNDFIGPVGATGLEVTLNDSNTLTLSTVKATVANLNARNQLQVAANGEIQAKAINLFLGQETGEAVGNAINYFNVQSDSVVTLKAGALSVTLKDASFFSANGNNALLPTFAFADNATQNLYVDSTIRLFLNGIQINDTIKRSGITSSQTAVVQMLQATQKKADSKSGAIERGIPDDLSERGVYPHAGVLKLKMPPCDAGNPSSPGCE